MVVEGGGGMAFWRGGPGGRGRAHVGGLGGVAVGGVDMRHGGDA